MNSLAFTDDFARRVAQAGREVRFEGGAWAVFSGGGEIRNYVRESGSSYVLSGAECAEPERNVMRAGSMLDIERYLTFVLGVDYRSRFRLPRIAIPAREEQASNGFGIISDDDGVKLVDENGIRDIVWLSGDDYLSRIWASRYSFYIDASPSLVWESMISPSGSPLFAGLAKRG